MANIRVEYLGNLRTKARHLGSNAEIITDAPVDNKGKGESFSPTDLCCTALATCAMTIMGIAAQENDMVISGATMDVTKTMAADPRRIAKIEIVFSVSGSFRDDQKLLLQRAAETCPVCLSLGPETEQIFTFNWLE